MRTAATISLDEFLRLKDDKPALEYACGEVLQKPMPTWAHSIVQRQLLLALAAFLQRTGLGEVAPELRCIFGPPNGRRAYVPDLVYVARERVTADIYLRSAPDLAIEILSPGQDMVRFLDKIQFYLLNRVRLVWVLDPEAGTIAVLTPGQEVRTLGTGDTLDGGDVLPGFAIAANQVFLSQV